jgi:hypothetical protein
VTKVTKHSLFKVCFAVSCLLVAGSYIARAETCSVGQHWTITQSGGAVVGLDVVQDRAGNLTGSGNVGGSNMRGHIPMGTEPRAGASRIVGRGVGLFIQWDNGALGHYEGNISPVSGIITGITFDETNPATQATFLTTQAFTCRP